MPDGIKLSEFIAWCAKYITGDEKGEAQLFLDRLFQAFGHAGLKEAGATLEFRVAKDAGGTAFADLVWKPVVLIEMKKRGTDLQKHYRQAFDYWTHLVPNRPRYVVLCNFDEFRVYDFDSDYNTPKDALALFELGDDVVAVHRRQQQHGDGEEEPEPRQPVTLPAALKVSAAA